MADTWTKMKEWPELYLERLGDAGVARITLNRPDRLNAWTVQMSSELREAFEKADADAGVRAIVLTGYGNIATAVTAVKMGAVDYLSKPADADDVVAALLASGTEKSELPSNPMSADRVRWEHIQRIYEMCNRNVSETARRLNMHRRTLQRILAKRAPR